MEPILEGTVDVRSYLGPGDERTLADDVLDGLTRPLKELPPKHFYDTRGSELFDQICELPEYYQTRTERLILETNADDIVERTGAAELVELGSGSASKTRVLLDAMQSAGRLERYVPVDVRASTVHAAAETLVKEYPGMSVHGVVGDFERHLEHVPEPVASGPRIVAFLGGTIGNFVPAERAPFLAALRRQLRPGEWFLLGADLVKDPAVLVPAYDDASGVTAEFNRNVLRVLNRRLDADFDVDSFAHVALWDADHEWIEMRLRAQRAMTVHLAALDLTVEFAEGEELRTEVSAKFRQEGLARELSTAGFAVRHWWTDRRGRFGTALAEAVPAEAVPAEAVQGSPARAD
jgi:L-histidine N-alpha-methyltransferase